MNVLQEVYVGDTESSAIADVKDALTLKYAAYREWGQDAILPESQSFDREFEQLRQGRFILGDADGCRSQLRELIADVGPANILLRPQWPGMPQERVLASLRRLSGIIAELGGTGGAS
ncbi:hypothetical protein [Saccharomonospora sp. CUA-673]|uniref:hypothetical protein n=1 Tax=Saccharomonospora sp. CUA-673 TaxID=1904969 RepID=UPI001300F44C|nr:hypothetical protein [Saccharomonospora sp. CUA-673]